MNIKVYGADWCIDCVNAKNFLDSKKVKFEYIDITENMYNSTLGNVNIGSTEFSVDYQFECPSSNCDTAVTWFSNMTDTSTLSNGIYNICSERIVIR